MPEAQCVVPVQHDGEALAPCRLQAQLRGFGRCGAPRYVCLGRATHVYAHGMRKNQNGWTCTTARVEAATKITLPWIQ